ncbi:MAG: xanthine dehydrogenase YagR molybdenum-binding subunit [Frankiaceae bacterium]|nr:xanthine dehydrogenase YagR molybdenum-binding subunit [Frankiaceae bacterium]
MTAPATREIGNSRVRDDGPAKVRGSATYAFEHAVEAPLYLHPVQSTIARGRVASVDTSTAEAVEGVAFVLTHANAPTLADTSDGEMSILQDDEVHFRGQFLGVVAAETPETAREAAGLVRLTYDEQSHTVVLDPSSDELYKPDKVNPRFETDTSDGDVDGALAASAVTLDQTYTTPAETNNPMEPHSCIAIWDGEEGSSGASLTLYDSTQGVHGVRGTLAPIFGLAKENVHVVAPNVGGGFGSKGMPHAHEVLATMAAMRAGGRPVKLALTRQQMFTLVGYRTPTIQRIRLGAGRDGRLTAIAHDVVQQTARIKEFAEQTATATRMMYAAPVRSTSHRLHPLDVSVPSWFRAPGEAPGMFAPEVALDELAVELGIDPVELRLRNEPEANPESGLPWSSRNLVACLRAGAQRFGWEQRDPTPGVRHRNGWLIGTGVASSVYPVYRMPGSQARVQVTEDGCYTVGIGAVDIGTGAWTSLRQIAADALAVPFEDVELQLADTALPYASVAGGSSGTTSWGAAITAAARQLRDQYGERPAPGSEVTAETPANEASGSYAMHAFGAHFVEAAVHADTGEVRVPRMLGVFAAGTIVNPQLARSQFYGGMTMGLGMALLENSVTDPRLGHVVTSDLAEYHVAANADVVDMQAIWLDEDDPYVSPMGSKGIGEIGIVGAAAAVANATWHATGIRVRDLPLTADKFVR